MRGRAALASMQTRERANDFSKTPVGAPTGRLAAGARRSPIGYRTQLVVLDLHNLDHAELRLVAIPGKNLGQRVPTDDLDQDCLTLTNIFLLEHGLPMVFQLRVYGEGVGGDAYPEATIIVGLVLEAPEACNLRFSLQVPLQARRHEGLDGRDYQQLGVAAPNVCRVPTRRLRGRCRLRRLRFSFTTTCAAVRGSQFVIVLRLPVHAAP
mmetsp:Transcript_118185/g.294833  ORF Transcript_118185/g.294833 Transcript_118185/m.294833 type:complete len:209 (+) Transcript_118185:16-642(+)